VDPVVPEGGSVVPSDDGEVQEPVSPSKRPRKARSASTSRTKSSDASGKVAKQVKVSSEPAASGKKGGGRRRRNLKGLSRYSIEREIGRGAMGVVHLARDLQVDRMVALKELTVPDGLNDERKAELVARFEREGKAAAKLDCAFAVEVYETFVDGDRRFIAMEYLDGATLSDLIAHGPMPVEAATSIVVQVLHALEAAQVAGVVHRDLKPDNIFVMPDGRVKVADFGVARMEDDASHLTKAGESLGTLGYMSPEQVKGEEVDARTDLFAVGVMLYEMLVGANPFHSDQPTTVMYRIAYEDPPALDPFVPGLPVHVMPVIIKATAKDAALRYQTATEMLADLEAGRSPDISAVTAAAKARAAEHDKAVKGTSRRLFPKLSIKLDRRTVIALAISGVILLAGAAGGYAIWSQKQKDAAARRVAIVAEAGSMLARLDRLKALRADFGTAMTTLRSKASANQAALNKWDADLRAQKSAYDARVAAVDKHNAAENAKQQASAVTQWDWYTGNYTTYTYTPNLLSYPAEPSPPPKVHVDLGPDMDSLAKLSADVTAFRSGADSSSVGAAYFPVVAQRSDEAAVALSKTVESTKSLLDGIVETDDQKGDMFNQTRLAEVDVTEVDAAIGAVEKELDLYLGNYGVTKQEALAVSKRGAASVETTGTKP
jgi:predicted Ser/Thr protein kinase